MIPIDCIPMHENETVLELVAGPNRYGQYTFFLYWIGQGNFVGKRGQVFLANPTEYQHDRIVDARRWPRTYHSVEREQQ
jgi:hypothetical protein